MIAGLLTTLAAFLGNIGLQVSEKRQIARRLGLQERVPQQHHPPHLRTARTGNILATKAVETKGKAMS